MCPEYSHEWDATDVSAESAVADEKVVKDANGNISQNGDTNKTVKYLTVQGAPKSSKAGTKVKNIRLE